MESTPNHAEPHPSRVVLVRRRSEYVKKACDFCKKRKKKCDQGRPCLFCVRHGEICSFTMEYDTSKSSDVDSGQSTKKMRLAHVIATQQNPSSSSGAYLSPMHQISPGASNGISHADSIKIEACDPSLDQSAGTRAQNPKRFKKLSIAELVEVKDALRSGSIFEAFDNLSFPSVNPMSLIVPVDTRLCLETLDHIHMKYFHDIHHTANPVLHLATFIENFESEPKILKMSVMALGRFDYLRETRPELTVEQCIEGMEPYYIPMVEEAVQITRDRPNCHALYGALLLAIFLTRVFKDSMELRRQISIAIIRHSEYFNPKESKDIHIQEITNSPYFIDQEERVRLAWVTQRQDLHYSLILGKPGVMKDVIFDRPPVPGAIWAGIPVPEQLRKGNIHQCHADQSRDLISEWPTDASSCYNLPKKDLSPLDVAIIQSLPQITVASLFRLSYQRACNELLRVLLKADLLSFQQELKQWYDLFPDQYKSTITCIMDPSRITIYGWQFYNLLSLYHVVQIWTHRDFILRHLYEHGHFDFDCPHFQSSVSSAKQIMNYLSGSLICNRRFAGMKAFSISSAYYAAIMFIAVAMCESDLVELSVAVYNVEKCLSCLVLLERTLPMMQGVFSSALRRLLSLVMAKHSGMLDITAFFDLDSAVSGDGKPFLLE